MKTVLIVDDCKEIRQLVLTTLDLGEFTVLEASSGSEAIILAEKYIPDLIIMDIVMPGLIDGIEATRHIKAQSETAGCQVIILTGSQLDRTSESLAAGAVDVLTKPFSPLDLIGKVEQILGIQV